MFKWAFEKAVDHAVEILAPKGSCSRGRWLTFELEAVGDEGGTFRYLLQYRPYSNYIDWRVIIPGNPHFKRGREQREWTDITTMSGSSLRVLAKLLGIPATWVGSTFKRDEITAQVVKAMPQNKVEIAPGYVICEGSHDSCWRDHAIELAGNPWKSSEQNPEYKDKTVYLSDPCVQDVKVYSVMLEGPVGGIWGEDKGRWEGLGDDLWVNKHPDTLTGAWAVYTATACLLGNVTGRTPPMDLQLDTTLQYYRDPKEGEDTYRNGLVPTSEERMQVAYRLDAEGNVQAMARDLSTRGLPQWEWSDTEPHILDDEHHFVLCRVSAAKIRKGHVEISHLWPR